MVFACISSEYLEIKKNIMLTFFSDRQKTHLTAKILTRSSLLFQNKKTDMLATLGVINQQL